MDDVLPDGDSFKITLRVLGAATVHLLKMREVTINIAFSEDRDAKF